MKKTVFITGASRGLGYTLAEMMRDQGYFVYSGVRDLTKAAPGTTAVFLDLSKEDTLINSVDEIMAKSGKLDILIHNGAIAYWGAVDSLTLTEAKDLFNVNFFAPFRLTQIVLPFMREQHGGKILFISSIRGVESCAYMGMYAASKAALESMAFDWASTLHRWNIHVSIAEPGPMDSNIELKHGTYFTPSQDNPYLPYGEVALNPQPLSEVCRVILENLSKEEPVFKFQTDEFSRHIVEKHLQDPSGLSWLKEQSSWVESNIKKSQV